MEYEPDYAGTRPMTGWVGWIVFAATIMIIQGVMEFIAGLSGILRDEQYFLGGIADGQVLVFNYTAWGWIHLIFGVVLLLVGLALFTGSTMARVVAIVLIGLNLVAQFTWVGVYPWWSLIMIAVDFFVLYALVVHGGELKND
jgi:hypothetical protein